MTLWVLDTQRRVPWDDRPGVEKLDLLLLNPDLVITRVT